MTTKLAGKDTYFLPFNQGSNGTGADGGAGNPPNPNGYPTAYLWENVFQKDSNTIHYKYHIHRFFRISRIIPLPIALHFIFRILNPCCIIQRRLRLKIADFKGSAPVLESVSQDMQHSIHITGIIKSNTEFARPNGCMTETHAKYVFSLIREFWRIFA